MLEAVSLSTILGGRHHQDVPMQGSDTQSRSLLSARLPPTCSLVVGLQRFRSCRQALITSVCWPGFSGPPR